MRVTFKNVLDRAYVTLFKDYKLDKLNKENEELFYTFLGGFLTNSIDMFDGCLKNLEYHEEEIVLKDEYGNPLLDDNCEEITQKEYVFDSDLSSKEMYILSLGVALGWYKYNMDDATQYKLHLSSKEYKSFSEQANIKSRLERLGALEEEFGEAIVDYQLHNINSIPFFGGE